MKIKIKKLNPDAVVPYKTHDSDFCYDVVATSCEEIAPNVYRYGTGLAFQIERGWEKITDHDSYFKTFRSPLKFSIDARPRSSVWKTGMVLSNCTGTIDEEYTGEVTLVFYHVNPSLPKYEVGDRIGQIKIGVTLPIEFIPVSELNNTERGEGKEGSTGK
jgi:dUTP pyrophosphatase